MRHWRGGPGARLAAGGAVLIVAGMLGPGVVSLPANASGQEQAPVAPRRPPVADAGSAKSVSSPERRRESRLAYHAQSAQNALATALEHFPGVVRGPDARPLKLRKGERVQRFLGPFSALIDVGGGRHLLAESTVPLTTTDAAGQRVPVDFALRDGGSAFAPAQAIVDVRIPKQLDAGVTLPGLGIVIHPVGADADGTEVKGRVFYANVGTDTDLIVEPTIAGVETYALIRSGDSPEDVVLRLELPAGARLKSAPSHPGALAIVRDGKSIASVQPPAAADADGQPVPVDGYRVRGNEVTLHVAHRERGFRYPILVDPQIVESMPWNSAGSDFNGWEINDHSGGRITYFEGGGWLGTGQYIETLSAQTFYSTDWGDLHFQAPLSAFISRAEVQGLRLDSPDGRACVFEGIWEGTRAVYVGPLYQTCTTTAPFNRTYCVDAGCPAVPSSTEVNSLVFGVQFNSTFFSNGWDAFEGGVTLYENDVKPPSAGVDSQTGLPSRWVDSATISTALYGSDYGLGLQRFKLDIPGIGTRVRSLACSGDRNSRCPASGNVRRSDDSGVSGDSFTYATGPMPDGIDTVSGWTEDAVGNQSPPRTWQVKVDHSAPSIALRGSLYDKRGQTLDNGVYHLRADATDGTPSVAASGVRDITVDVDGVSESTATQPCTTDSCPLSLDYEFGTPAHLPGTHTITVTTTDQLGHARTYPSFTVTVPDPATCTDVFFDPGTALQPLSVGTGAVCDQLGQVPPPTSTGHGTTCDYTSSQTPLVSVFEPNGTRSVVVYEGSGMSGQATAAVGVCYYSPRIAGPVTFAGGTVEAGGGTPAGGPGGYVIFDGDNANVDPFGASDGYYGVSNFETGTKGNCDGGGFGTNSGGCFEFENVAPPLPVPLMACGNTGGNTWDSTGHDGCSVLEIWNP